MTCIDLSWQTRGALWRWKLLWIGNLWKFGSVSARYPVGSIGCGGTRPGHQNLSAERKQIITCLHRFRSRFFFSFENIEVHTFGSWVPKLALFRLFPLTALDRNWYVWARTPWSCNVPLPWNVYRTEILEFSHPKLSEDNEMLLSRSISFKDLQRGCFFVPGPFWFESCTGRFQAVFYLALCIHPNLHPGCWQFQDPVRGEHCEHTWRAQNMEPLVLRCTYSIIAEYSWIDNMVWQRGHVYMPQLFWECINKHPLQTNLKRNATFWYRWPVFFPLAEIFYIGRLTSFAWNSSNGNRQCFSLDAYLRSNRQVQCKFLSKQMTSSE